jgi:5S rRNA maturation endonuclease (ribonuclease M5)
MTIDTSSIKAQNPLDATVERLTGQPIVKHKIFAPWRQEDTPSVHIYDDGSWWDYGAGKGGDVIDFVGFYKFGQGYNPDTHFLDVVDALGALDIQPRPRQAVRPAPEKPKLTIGLDDVMRWHDTMPQARRNWWHSRGLDDATINRFFLGWDGKRYTIPAIYRLVPFGVKRRQSEVDDGLSAKYVSITGSRVGLFNADTLWNADAVTICEGEIDAMLLERWGYRAVTTTGGAGTWKPEWVRFFAHVKRLVILYDNDAAGREGAAKVHATLRRAEIVTLPEGVKDVGELMEKHPAPVSWLAANLW